jgi:hypothetical protein
MGSGHESRRLLKLFKRQYTRQSVTSTLLQTKKPQMKNLCAILAALSIASTAAHAQVQIPVRAYIPGPYGESLYISEACDIYTATGQYYGHLQFGGGYTVLNLNDGSQWALRGLSWVPYTKELIHADADADAQAQAKAQADASTLKKGSLVYKFGQLGKIVALRNGVATIRVPAGGPWGLATKYDYTQNQLVTAFRDNELSLTAH